jgi:RAT1-interacting protein
MLMESSFIEENNVYKNQQKQIQQNQRMPQGMASQDLMAYWGTVTAP